MKPIRVGNLGEFRVLTLRDVPVDLFSELCDTPERARAYWEQHIASNPSFNPDVETMAILCLNTRRRVTGHFVVATGTLDTLLCHPREVFRGAIVANAAAIVVMHNHPSGDPAPSEADIKVTRDLIRGGQVLKLEVLDHVIAGRVSEKEGRASNYCSLRELGYFYS